MNQDGDRDDPPPLEAKKELPDCRGQAFEEPEKHHTLSDRNQPGDKRDRGFQMPGYFLAELLKAFENRAVILHIHVDHTLVLRGSEEALHYETLFRVTF